MNVDYESYARQLRKTILQYTGIPVSIGIASTKTLTKVANHIAKDDDSLGGVCSLVEYKNFCLLYTSPSPRDATLSRMPSSA